MRIELFNNIRFVGKAAVISILTATLLASSPSGAEISQDTKTASSSGECPPGISPKLIGRERWLTIENPSEASFGTALNFTVNQAADCFRNIPPGQRGIILVKAGVHILDRGVRLGSNTTLQGEGIGRTVLKFKPRVDDDEAVGVASKRGPYRDIYISGLSLVGPGPTQDKEIDGIQLRRTSGAKIQEVEVSDFSRDGIHFSYQGSSEGVNSSTISQCIARHNGRNGISITKGSNNEITHCLIEGNNLIRPGITGVGGIVLEPDSSNEVSATTVTENTVIGNLAFGILLATENKETGGNKGNSVCSNYLSDNGFSAIAEKTENPSDSNGYYANNPQPERPDVMSKSIISPRFNRERCEPRLKTPEQLGI